MRESASACFIPVFDAGGMKKGEKGKQEMGVSMHRLVDWTMLSRGGLKRGSFSNHPVQQRIRSWKGDHFESQYSTLDRLGFTRLGGRSESSLMSVKSP